MRLHGVEGRLIDQPWRFDLNNFARVFETLGLAALVELVTPDIGRAGRQTMVLTDAPTPTVARENAPGVRAGHDRFDAHRA